MTSKLITGYVAGLRRGLPARVADEAVGGLLDTYEQNLAAGAAEQDAARAAVADFGDLETVVGEFTRQAPGRRAARLLLATGPVAGGCWAAALLTSRAWTWPAPGPQPGSRSFRMKGSQRGAAARALRSLRGPEGMRKRAPPGQRLRAMS